MLTPQASDIMPTVKTGDDDHEHKLRHEIAELLPRIVINEANEVHADQQTWKRALQIAWQLKQYRPPGPCKSCRLQVVDILRLHIGLTYARRPASQEMREKRLAICHACPVYQKKTGSCGRLILDAIKPRIVEAHGRNVQPCGCLVALKVTFKSEHCPGNFWIR